MLILALQQIADNGRIALAQDSTSQMAYIREAILCAETAIELAEAANDEHVTPKKLVHDYPLTYTEAHIIADKILGGAEFWPIDMYNTTVNKHAETIYNALVRAYNAGVISGRRAKGRTDKRATLPLDKQHDNEV